MMRRTRLPLFLLILPASGLLAAAAPSPVHPEAAAPAGCVNGAAVAKLRQQCAKAQIREELRGSPDERLPPAPSVRCGTISNL